MLQVPRVYKVKRAILVREVLLAKMDKRGNKAQLEYKGKREQLVKRVAQVRQVSKVLEARMAQLEREAYLV